MDQPAIKIEINPSASQITNHELKVGWRAATTLASRAVAPIAISPRPEMPVKEVARSMVSRI
jgi:hypothetical protein